ncbi:Rho GTPase-activating protein REN1-like protein isoform X1 [Tanacetum coccineum]
MRMDMLSETVSSLFFGNCHHLQFRHLAAKLCYKHIVRTDRGSRVNNMRTAICDTFPEPNRRLLQRILMTMEAVAENKDVNRMSVPAVAACMSPLLLRPLLAGEVDLDSEFNMGGDGSAQLMQAAAAANHAQAIIITLLEEYDNIFGVRPIVILLVFHLLRLSEKLS